MDNFFEYLIIIFFIFSIIQSIFAKKKKEAARKKESSAAQQEVKAPAGQKPKSTDILEQLFGIKLPLPEPAEQPIPRQAQERYREAEVSPSSWDPSSEYKDVLESKSFGFDRQEYEYAERRNQDLFIHTAEMEIEDIPIELDTVEHVKSQRLIHFRKIMMDPKNLKDYIIIQELLNKPKAFGE